ncbi:ABC transporter permease [Nocardia brasiliensis]|uniref:ABC transporter permease n=1 Tax=Nocardia brasiliensis TaxID=37326 RepID=UPI0004A6C3BE|nr:ABC transporter permease [Nocardia brasiliensis]
MTGTTRGDSTKGRPAGRAWVRETVVSALALVLALAVGAVLIIVSDPNVTAALGYFFARPLDTVSAAGTAVGEAYRALFLGAFGGKHQIAETLVAATPLICTGLAVTLAFRTGLFNIGAQGQLIAGALCAGWVGFALHLPPVLHVVVALLAGVAGGALWGGLAGLLKARTGAHEVITTIMGNYVALYALTWLLTTSTLQRPGRNEPISPVVDETAQLPRFGDTRLHLGLLVALGAAGFVWWLLSRSTLGFRLRAVGANPDAARTAGMSVGKAYALAMLLAGGLAGLAGAQQVLGTALPLTNGIAGSFGFDGITVALLGRGSPIGTVYAALLFGALNAGGNEMQAATGTPLTLVTVLQAVIVVLVAAPAVVRTVFRIKAERADAVLAKGWN